MRFTVLTIILLAASQTAVCGRHVQRDWIGDIASVFGGGAATSTSGPPTPGPPAQPTVTKSTTSSAKSSTIPSSLSFSVSLVSFNFTTSTTTSNPSTFVATTTTSSSTTVGPSIAANAAPTASATPSNSNSVSPGGIAVAVILSLFTLGLIAWVIFRYHPRSRTWWAARQERKYQERSYREALDGPGAFRKRALGDDDRRTYLGSFFAPRTARLGGGKEIRRKPVNWGVTEDKVPLADISSLSGSSHMLVQSEKDHKGVPPLPPAYQKPLPPPK